MEKYHTSSNSISALWSKQKPHRCRIPSTRLRTNKEIETVELYSVHESHFSQSDKKIHQPPSLSPFHSQQTDSLASMQQTHLFASPFTSADSARIIKTQQQQNSAQPHTKILAFCKCIQIQHIAVFCVM